MVYLLLSVDYNKWPGDSPGWERITGHRRKRHTREIHGGRTKGKYYRICFGSLSDRLNPISAEQFGYNQTIINDQEYMALLKECFWLGFLPKGSAFGRNGSSQKPNLLGGTLVLPNIRFGRTFGLVRFGFCRTCSGFGQSLLHRILSLRFIKA